MRIEEYKNLDTIKQINELSRLLEKASEWYEVSETEGAELDIRETAKNLFKMGVRVVDTSSDCTNKIPQEEYKLEEYKYRNKKEL